MDKIGRYEIIKQVGKGGMGEVYLAYDPACQRKVALKIIKKELASKASIKNRFLREVQITSFLTHPSIVPIYSIHRDKETIYYTMLYLEGKTLHELINDSILREEGKEIFAPSLKDMIRFFLALCEAMYYSHSKGVLHRDIKPDNIITGNFGEIMILDWGIAEKIEEQKPNPKEIPEKIAGTVSYMAPERAMGKNATVKSEIYSLGVILYRLLTLKLPFYRKDLEHYRKRIDKEIFIDPIETAPYREIPNALCEIVKKSLEKEEKRYGCVSEIIDEIKNYIDGKPNWIFLQTLDMKRKKDWLFQENVLLAQHIAITKQIDVTEWVSMMVAKGSFSQNIKIEAEIKISEKGEGIGFLLSIPRAKQRKGLDEGYCIWLGSKINPSIQLFKSNVLIADVPDVCLEDKWTKIRIEKEDEHIKLYINSKLILTHSSHLPLAGPKIGLVLKDEEFSIRNCRLYGKSHKVSISCLEVPNAFLARKDYTTALEEYRKIGNAFLGRAEGREALFRAGLTILEKAKETKNEAFFQKALDEFQKLDKTPGAPLEYLGKAMVYQALQNYSEEAICLEFCLRKFKNHSLIPVIEEHIVSRLHKSSLDNREAAFRLSLLSLLHLPKILKTRDTKNLLLNLEAYFEKLDFLTNIKDEKHTFVAIKLCFFLEREKLLIELFQKTKSIINKQNCFLSLLELGYIDEAQKLLPKDSPLSFAIKAHIDSPEKALKSYSETNKSKKAVLYHIGQLCLDKEKPQVIVDHLKQNNLLYTQALMYTNRWDEVKKLFEEFKKQDLLQEGTYLHTLYGCFLAHEKGEKAAKEFFTPILETPFPSFRSLLGPYLLNKLPQEWEDQAFFFEKRELYRQLGLYYHCSNNLEKKKEYLERVNEKTKS